MKGGRIKCKTCKNRVGGDFCTMQKDMKVVRYQSCEGYVKSVPKLIVKEVVEKKHKIIVWDLTTSFGRFILKGGHFSCRTGKFNVFDSEGE